MGPGTFEFMGIAYAATTVKGVGDLTSNVSTVLVLDGHFKAWRLEEALVVEFRIISPYDLPPIRVVQKVPDDIAAVFTRERGRLGWYSRPATRRHAKQVIREAADKLQFMYEALEVEAEDVKLAFLEAYLAACVAERVHRHDCQAGHGPRP